MKFPVHCCLSTKILGVDINVSEEDVEKVLSKRYIIELMDTRIGVVHIFLIDKRSEKILKMQQSTNEKEKIRMTVEQLVKEAVNA